jgi:hypothetical protein
MNKTTHSLLAALSLALPLLAQAEPPSRKSFVDFNTQCARCHEGECSGRLSFSSGSEGAANHLRRYLGELTEAEINELYGLLRYTKEKCQIYPFATHWDAEPKTLEHWRSSNQKGYFIPLGSLEPGEFRLELELETPGPDSWQLLDQAHEILAEGRFCPKAQSQGTFTQDKEPLYLQLLGQGQIKSLQIKPVAD